jgi:hypothetical protein
LAPFAPHLSSFSDDNSSSVHGCTSLALWNFTIANSHLALVAGQQDANVILKRSTKTR